MAIDFLKQFTLKDKQSISFLELESRTDSIFYIKIDLAGNSLLSTVFAESGTGNVKVDYFDFTTGFDDGELNPLKSHIDLSSFPDFNKILVTNSHDKIVIKITITGTVRFGLYGTVVSNSVSDMDAALKYENELVNFLLDKGSPIVGLDRLNGLWKFLSTDETGSLYVKTNDQVGDPFYHEYQGLTESGIEKSLFSHTIAATKQRKLTKIYITSNEPGTWRLYADSVIIMSGRITPANPESHREWIPSKSIDENKTYELKFETFPGRPNKNVEAYLMGNEVDK